MDVVPVHVGDEDALNGAEPEGGSPEDLLEGAVAAVDEEGGLVCRKQGALSVGGETSKETEA